MRDLYICRLCGFVSTARIAFYELDKDHTKCVCKECAKEDSD